MTQALQEQDLRDFLRQPGAGRRPARRRRVRRVRWRLRPRAALVLRFLTAAVGWSLAALIAAGDPRLDGGLAVGAAWVLAGASSLVPLDGGQRSWWLRGFGTALLPLLAAGWVLYGSQQVLPFGTGASASLVALGLGALGVRLLGFPWDTRVLAFFPGLALLSVPLEIGWASPGAGQYTLFANLLLWGLAALTVPAGEGADWSPRAMSLEVIARSEGPATVGLIGTLGELHLDPTFRHFDLDVLEAQVRAFRPDVMCVALTPDDLHAYRHAPARVGAGVEYAQCLLPLAESEAVAVVPVDQAGEDLRVLARAALHDPRLGESDHAQRDRLRALWQRPELGHLACLDEAADEAARACHEAREAVAPDLEQVLWQQRNEGILAGVLDVLRENPGRRVLVVVGAEQVYWLREALATAGGLHLLPSA